jgi:transposase
MTYSFDFRKLAMRLLAEKGTYRAVSNILHVSISTLHRWKKMGIRGTKRRRQKIRPKLTDHVLEVIRHIIGRQPVTTLDRLKKNLKEVELCRHTIASALRILRISRKRASHRLGGPSSLPEDSVVYAFCEKASLALKADAPVVSLDECYFSERVLPLYGYSALRTKCTVRSPVASWKQRSLLLAVANDGTTAHVTYDGSVNKERFQKFVESMPYPPGTTILLDNVAFHKDTRTMVARGFVPLFTPKYSPEFNPVENVFSKVKGTFRNEWPWVNGVVDAISSSLQGVSPTDIIGCFENLRERLEARNRENVI